MNTPSLKNYLNAEPEAWELSGAAKRLWETVDDRAVALYGGVLLDVALTQNLLARMWTNNGAAEDELTGNDGPLGSFSRKIRLGEAMRLYGPKTRRQLDTIRSIRNAFAHTHRAITFDTAPVPVLCSTLDDRVWPYRPRRPASPNPCTSKIRFKLWVMGLWLVMRARAKQTQTGTTDYSTYAPVVSWWGEKYPTPLP